MQVFEKCTKQFQYQYHLPKRRPTMSESTIEQRAEKAAAKAGVILTGDLSERALHARGQIAREAKRIELRGDTNKQFAATDSKFRAACDEANIEPTARQASKWRASKGRAFFERPVRLAVLRRELSDCRNTAQVAVFEFTESNDLVKALTLLDEPTPDQEQELIDETAKRQTLMDQLNKIRDLDASLVRRMEALR